MERRAPRLSGRGEARPNTHCPGCGFHSPNEGVGGSMPHRSPHESHKIHRLVTILSKIKPILRRWASKYMTGKIVIGKSMIGTSMTRVFRARGRGDRNILRFSPEESCHEYSPSRQSHS